MLDVFASIYPYYFCSDFFLVFFFCKTIVELADLALFVFSSARIMDFFFRKLGEYSSLPNSLQKSVCEHPISFMSLTRDGCVAFHLPLVFICGRNLSVSLFLILAFFSWIVFDPNVVLLL